MARYCPNCGTEVDETAAFCPTCGQPIDQAAEAEIPPAPAWPDPVRSAEPERSAAEQEPPARRDDPEPAAEQWVEEPTRVEAAPPPPPPQPAPVAQRPPAEAGARRGPSAQVNLPVTWPVTLSAWLIGIGAVVAALGVVIGMFRVVNVIDLLLLVLLLAIAASVFFSTTVPAIPHLRLATLVVVLIAFGVALDRLGFGAANVGTLMLFLGTAAGAIGCVLLEVGRDQPLGPRA